MKLCTKFERNRAIRGGFIATSLWPYDLEHILSVALGSGIIFTKCDVRQLICAWITAFLCWYVVTLWSWPLTSWPWKFVVKSLYKIWAKSNNPRLSDRRFSAFSRAILEGGWTELTELSQGSVEPTSPNLARHRAIALHFYFRIRKSCCIFKRGRLKVEWCFKQCQISLFLALCKN